MALHKVLTQLLACSRVHYEQVDLTPPLLGHTASDSLAGFFHLHKDLANMASVENSQNQHEKELVGWFYPTDEMKSEAYVSSMDRYKELYDKSIDNPAEFWADIASEFFWKVPPSKEKFMDFNFDTRKGNVFIKWMEGAVTNISYNVLDRNVEKGLGENVAFYW